MRVLGLALLLGLPSFACAHGGFDALAWQELLGAYTVTVLEDFHTGRNEAQLFVQLSDGNRAAPTETQVSATVQHGDETIYAGEVPFVATNSADGKTFYSGYLLTLPLTERGVYRVKLNVSGPLGTATTGYFVKTQDGVRALEYLPSALVLLIALGGVALLFVPLNRPRKDAYGSADVSVQTPRAHES